MTKLIYGGSETPHYQMKDAIEGEEVYLSSTHHDKAHFVIGDQDTSLEDVIAAHSDGACIPVVLANNPREVQTAIDSYCDFEHKGKRYAVRKQSIEKRILLKLQFSHMGNWNGFAKRYIETMVNLHGFLYTPEELKKHILDTGAKPAQDILENHFHEYLAPLREQIVARNSITERAGLTEIVVDSIKDVDTADLLAHRTVILATKMGDGKTEAMQAAAKAVERSLILSHRKSIADSTFPDSAHYKHITPGTEAEIPSIKCVVNSGDRPYMQEFILCKPLDLLIIDEGSQVMDHFVEGKFDGNKRYNRYTAEGAMCNAIATAKQVIVADALANDEMVEMLRELRGDDIALYENKDKSNGVTIYLEDYETAEKLMQDEIVNGRACVATDSKKLVERYTAKGKSKGRNMLGITGENIQSHIDVMQDPRLVANFDSFLFSPVITSSFSLLEDCFSGYFALLSGINSPRNGVQQIKRPRLAKEFTVGLRRPMELGSEDYREILRKSLSDGNETDTRFAKREAAINFEKNNAPIAFPIIAELAGFKVVSRRTALTDEQKAEGVSTKASAIQIESAEYKERLRNAKPANSDTISELRESQEGTAEASIANDRAKLEKATGTSDIQDRHLSAWGRGALAKKVRNLEIVAFMSPEIAKLKTKDEMISKPAPDVFNYSAHYRFFELILATLNIDINPRKEVEVFIFTKAERNSRDLLKPFNAREIKSLSKKQVLNDNFLNGFFTVEDANKLGEFLYRCGEIERADGTFENFDMRKAFNRLDFDKTLYARKKGQKMTFTRTARDLLRQFGIDTEGGVTKQFKREDGSTYQLNGYQVTAKSAELMREFIQNRMAKGLTLL